MKRRSKVFLVAAFVVGDLLILWAATRAFPGFFGRTSPQIESKIAKKFQLPIGRDPKAVPIELDGFSEGFDDDETFFPERVVVREPGVPALEIPLQALDEVIASDREVIAKEHLQAGDFNFDGAMDLRIFQGCGSEDGAHECRWVYLLFSGTKRAIDFKRDDVLDATCDATFNSAKREVHSRCIETELEVPIERRFRPLPSGEWKALSS